MAAFHRRKFTDEQKESILAEANERGISAVLREYKLSYSVFSRWKEKIQLEDNKQEDASGFKMMRQLKNLAIENERLKKIIANQALEIQIKTEMLGKPVMRS